MSHECHDPGCMRTEPHPCHRGCSVERSQSARVPSVTSTGRLKSNFQILEKEEANNPKAFKAFRKKMEGRQYGVDALLSAWAWFEMGWEAGLESKGY